MAQTIFKDTAGNVLFAIDGVLLTTTLRGTSSDPYIFKPKKGVPTRSRNNTISAAVSVLAANPDRLSAIFQNVGTTDVWIAPVNTVSASIGFKLEPGRSLVDNVTTSQWWAFCASTGLLEIMETV